MLDMHPTAWRAQWCEKEGKGYCVFCNKNPNIYLFAADLLYFSPRPCPALWPHPPAAPRHPLLHTLQLFSCCTYGLICKKPMWSCMRLFWLMFSMRWGLWDGVPIIPSAPFLCQGAELIPGVKDRGWLLCPPLMQRGWLLARQTWAFKMIYLQIL